MCCFLLNSVVNEKSLQLAICRHKTFTWENTSSKVLSQYACDQSYQERIHSSISQITRLLNYLKDGLTHVNFSCE